MKQTNLDRALSVVPMPTADSVTASTGTDPITPPREDGHGSGSV